MDKPTRNNEGHPFVDLRDDYGEAWKYIEHLETRLGMASAVAKGSLRSVSEQASRIQVLESELFKESARGDFLNARNGRLEHEISLVRPGSMAKALMEAEYVRMRLALTNVGLECQKEIRASLHREPGEEVDTYSRDPQWVVIEDIAEIVLGQLEGLDS